MMVLKKNGKIEEFNITKIKTGIINSADDINFLLTEGDINMLLNQINKKLSEIRKNDQNTTSYEIRGVMYHILMDNNFEELTKSYMKL